MKKAVFSKILVISCIFAGILFSYSVVAQQAITLDQAIQTAKQQHPLLQSSEIAIEIATKTQAADKVSLYPDIHGSFSLQHNLIIPSTPVPIGKLQGNLTSDEFALIKFGTNWQSGIGLNLSYDIFNPSRKQQLIESSTALQNARLDQDATLSSIELGTISAYSNLVLAGMQLKFAVEDTLVNSAQWNLSQLLYQNNRLTKSDLNTSEQTYLQSLSRFRQAQNIYEQAQIELSYQLGNSSENKLLYTPSDSLQVLISRLSESMPSSLSLAASVGYRKVLSQSLNDSLSLINTRRKYLPTVSLVATLGSNFYEQNPVLFNAKDWYGNSLIGLQVNIPLTQDFVIGHNVSAARLKVKQNQLLRNDFVNRRRADLDKVISDVSFYRDDLKLKESSLKLSLEKVKISQDLLAQGRIIPSDLMNQQLSSQNAKLEYLQTAFNLINAQIQLKQLLQDQ